MKREIKFRAWNESAKRYSKPFGLMGNVLNYTDDDGLGVIKSLTDEVVEQYTGLKDKNDKEIYEGDIVKLLKGHKTYLNELFEINWQKGSFGLLANGFTIHTSFGFYFKKAVDNNVFYSHNQVNGSCFEIVGNVHQNPELI